MASCRLIYGSRKALFMVLVVVVSSCLADGKLSPKFYSKSCPSLQDIVRKAMTKAVSDDRQTSASILRMFYHDCFVKVYLYLYV